MGSDSSPIFIMGSERSGTNLLRTLLSNHSSLCGPIAPHLMNAFSDIIPYYGSLSVKKNALKLCEDMLSIINHPLHKWNLEYDSEEIYEKHNPNEFFDFFHIFYNEKKNRESKRRFVCKELRTYDFFVQINRYYSSVKFIYMYRDPRGVASSWLKLPPVSHGTPLDTVIAWNREQEKYLNICKQIEVHWVKYENLLKAPKETMTGLLTFLGEPVEESCFNVQTEKNLDFVCNELWKNLAKPIINSNGAKYLKYLDKNCMNMIETITRKNMVTLGYELTTNADWQDKKLKMLKRNVKKKVKQFSFFFYQNETYRIIKSRQNLKMRILEKRKKEFMGKKREFSL